MFPWEAWFLMWTELVKNAAKLMRKICWKAEVKVVAEPVELAVQVQLELVLKWCVLGTAVVELMSIVQLNQNSGTVLGSPVKNR